ASRALKASSAQRAMPKDTATGITQPVGLPSTGAGPSPVHTPSPIPGGEAPPAAGAPETGQTTPMVPSPSGGPSVTPLDEAPAVTGYSVPGDPPGQPGTATS
ncbi:MAG: hypothetical protein Q7T55_06370, partial [Solirubrobacteraceae bacterium]|nr:hypothetical protein [Solirubrobacteraceae bacterium]